MNRLFLIPAALFACNFLVARPATAQTYAETQYAKRVSAVRQLDRQILQKRVEAKGMLRVAGELQRRKPRPRAEAQMIVPRYDEHTRMLIEVNRHETQVLKKIGTIESASDVTALRQELEIEKRTMELRFKKQQTANAQLRKSQRQRGTKVKNNRHLQAVIEQQKQAKQAYDAALNVIAEQLSALRTIETAGGPGDRYDTSGNELHSNLTKFDFVIMPQRELERPWVEKQAKYALLDSVEKRVKLHDKYRSQATTLRQEADQLSDTAYKLLSGPAATDELLGLAKLVKDRVVSPTAMVRIELTPLRNDPVSNSSSGIAVERQKMTFSGRAGGTEFDATLSPSLTQEEVNAPKWALKFKDKYPFVHSAGVLSLWVGEFHIAIKPKNGLVRRASPKDRSNMLQWIDDTLNLDRLATL